ncbi:D-2-hydroxyacid dehydrogenase [Alteromonas sp. 345S023]|uniref:D-2-hydroxyacid dehydrogenase n=1 Tax=Alteromonas profundi TaxID=2696062 RepID=A0A7X5LJ33_9ALTE|nr:D-2-hydroxyacid dehydrogenase [Alteromonas profundi]NDV90297.1 D-2-hydroxyacid dehydrogenase [Alteromonas profundi]
MTVKTMANSTYELTILSQDATALTNEIDAQLNASEVRDDLRIVQVASHVDEVCTEDISLLLAAPDLAARVVPECRQLKWCQSTWAGNRRLLALNKQDYLLTGVKGIFGSLMREYVFAYLLQYARNVQTFAKHQASQPPIWEASPRLPLNGKVLGIAGIGSIGQALIPVALSFGMRVIGLSRSGQAIEGVEHVFTPEQRITFAKRCDHIVNLMPDTEETTGLLDRDFFAALPRHSVFINAGRGNAVKDDDLLTSMNDGRPAFAVLDVFRQEPLPSNHPFWHHPNIAVTSHTAAESTPYDVAQVFVDNFIRLKNGLPLRYQFDFSKGY